MALSILGILVVAGLAVIGLTIVYCVIRFAVRDGMLDAQRRIEVDRVRAELRLGHERSPNSRR